MMKAGTYYVGDLCYVMHEAWDEFCELTIEGHVVKDGQFQLKDGREFAFSGTAFGDGTYFDQEGREYSVDAGLIGCILLEDIDQTVEGNWTDGGQIITIDQDFEVTYDEGVISFGQIRIDTDPYIEDEEEEDYEYEDEE